MNSLRTFFLIVFLISGIFSYANLSTPYIYFYSNSNWWKAYKMKRKLQKVLPEHKNMLRIGHFGRRFSKTYQVRIYVSGLSKNQKHQLKAIFDENSIIYNCFGPSLNCLN